MKKLFTPILVLAASASFSQTTFWTENFGTGCNRGQLATAYAGSNGAWTETVTGVNATYYNPWFVSATAAGTAVNTCASNCQVMSLNTNQTLHVGNPTITIFTTTIMADTTATYLTGIFCGSGYCSATDRRVESPTINCTNRNTITASFLYYENGETTNDDASMWYFNGVTWSNLNALAKTPLGSCSPAGQWIALTVNLPASADNNANVKIGYRWINNDDGVGSDPSFAIDDIALSGFLTIGYNETQFPELNVWSDQNNVFVAGMSSYKISGIYNVVGQAVSFTSEGDHYTVNVTTGIYFVELEIEGVKVIKKIMIR